MLSPSLKHGLILFAVNGLIILGFFGVMFGSVALNGMLHKAGKGMLPVVPIVVLVFGIITPAIWFFVGSRLRSSGKPRFFSGVIGGCPMILGCVGAGLWAVFSVVTGHQSPAAVVVPVVIGAISVVAAAIFVLVIMLTARAVVEPAFQPDEPVLG